MILAIRSARPRSDPPSVERGGFSAAEAKAATLEMEGREMDTKSSWMVEKGRVPCLAHCRAIYTVCRQVVTVEVKMEADAKARMLETLLVLCWLDGQYTLTWRQSLLHLH